MPNNDLGTAHGRIRIDFDEKGSKDASLALQKIQKQFELLNDRVALIEKSFNKNEKSINSNTKAIKKADKETSNWLFTLMGGDRILKVFDKDIIDLTQDISKLYTQYSQARQKFKPLEQTFKVLDRFQRLRVDLPISSLNRALSGFNFKKLAQGERDLRAFNRALNSVGWGLAALRTVAVDTIIGRKSAMNALPTWTRSAHNFAIALTGLGAAGLAAGKKLNAGWINNFLNTNLFRNLVLQANNAGNAFAKLGSLTQRVFGKNLFAKLTTQLKDSENILSRWTKNTSYSLSSASRGFNAWFKPVAAAAKQIQTFTLGVGLMAAGIGDIGSRFAWLGRIPKPLLVALATVISTVLPAALQVFDKALVGTSNVLNGLLMGVKQLSGGLLALPGLIAGIGAVRGTFSAIFSDFVKDGIDKLFSSVQSEADEVFQTFPEHLKPMATALKETGDKWRELRKELQVTAFKDVENQIRSLSEKYLPILQTGMGSITLAMRSAKDEFVKFLEQSQSQKDVASIFANTSETLLNLKNALRPVLDGLRDIATVGTQFFAEWSSGLGSVTEKFAAWARANRESGQLLEWMREAEIGTRDLVKGTKELSSGLWNVLTMFRSNTGVNFLDRYAESMKKFNVAVKQSRQGGVLFDFSSAVRGFADTGDKINIFKEVFVTFVEMLKSVGPAIQNLSDAFSFVFIDSLKAAMDALGLFSKIMTALNIDQFTGLILGLVAAFKLLPTFAKPLWDISRVVLGFIATMKSASGVVKAVGDGVEVFTKALETVPLIGAKSAAAIRNVHKSMSGVIAAMAMVIGPITLTVAALTALWLVMRSGRENAEAFDNQLATNTANVKKFGKELTQAFYADNGKIGATVMDQVSIGMETMLRDLEDTAAKAPGFIDHIADYFKNGQERAGSIPVEIPVIGTIAAMTRDSGEINRRQKEGDAAKLAAEKYRELTDQQVDLTMVMTGSQAAFDARIGNLRAQGKAGNALADVMIRQRNEFNQVNEAMQALGPKGVALAKGLDEIARAGGDATTKLNGLRSVLQGLGFLKVDELEAAAQYTETLGDLADQIRQLKEDGADFSNIWKADGTLDDTQKSAAKLIPILSQVSNAYLQAAASGKDVDEINTRLNQTLEQVAPSLNRTPEQLKEYFKNNMGAAPVPIKLALQLDGVQDQFAKDIGNLMLQLYRNQEFQIPITLGFDSDEAANTFDDQLEVLLRRDLFDQNGHTVVLKAGVKLEEADVLALQQYLANNANIQTSTGPIVDPAKLPVAMPEIQPPPQPVGPRQPNATPPWVPGAVTQPFSPQQEQHPFYPAPVEKPQTLFPAAPPAGGVTPGDLGGLLGNAGQVNNSLGEASAKVDEVEGKLRKFASSENIIKVNSDELNNVKTQIDELDKTFNEKKLKAQVEVAGTEKLDEIPAKAQAMTEKFTGLFTGLKDKLAEAVEATKTKVAELSESVVNTLNTAAESARDAGSKFVDALAQGIETNPEAIRAAERLAAEIKQRFHQSPPKKGPLSEHGDAALYGGKAFVRSYATGLRNSAAMAGDAAGVVAGAAAGGLGTASGSGGAGQAASQFFSQFIELTNFASSIVDIFSRISESVFSFAKFLSDPMGKGSFFGGSLGFKKLSDAELRKRRDREDQQGLRSAMDGAQRDDTAFQRRMEIITNAENAVVEDSGGKKSQEAPQTVGAMLKAAFPEIASIGGARQDALPYHSEGRALDIMIPNYDTKEGKALGDRINSWALANAEKLGITDTIWQDYWQPTDGGQGNFMGNSDPNQGHYNHVHLTFASGAQVDMSGLEMNPEELADYTKKSAQDAAKTALEALQEQYGPPSIGAGEALVTPQQARLNPATGQFELFTPEGQQDLPDGYLNPETKKPWTAAEAEQYVRENPQVITLPDGMSMDRLTEVLNNPDFVSTSQEETLNLIADGNSEIAKALEIAQDPRAFDDRSPEVLNALTAVDQEIIRLRETGTVGNDLRAQDLESIKSTIMDQGGYEQNANPIDTLSGMIANAAGVTSDILGTVVTSIESIGAADNIAKTLVRGVSGTKDVDKVIDNVQKFIELGSKIAGSVAGVSGLISSIAGAAGGADPSGGTSGVAAAFGSVSTIASLVQAGYETANAVIDMTQEAMRIVGSYVGDFLGYLVGGTGGQLTGNVKFLLDEQTNQLLSYTAENAMDKRVFDRPFRENDTSSREQMIGNINVYGGPGSDPRDLTRQMMFQVNSAQYAGALSQ